MTKINLAHILKHRVQSVGMNYDVLLHAEELVVFGSYAAGVNDPESDVDVLAVGPRIRITRSGLDLTSVSSQYLTSAEWLGSELASHIAVYGVWIHGTGRWKELTALSKRAELAKAARIERLLCGLRRAWPTLHPIFHSRYRQGVRRELQRLELLRQKIAVPPGALLDSYWCGAPVYQNQIAEVLKSLNISSEILSFAFRGILSPERARAETNDT